MRSRKLLARCCTALVLGAVLVSLPTGKAAAASLRVPAFTAYVEPLDRQAPEVSEERGVSGWTDPRHTVSWFGQFQRAGGVHCQVAVRLSEGKESRLRLQVGDQSREAAAQGTAGADSSILDFGEFKLAQPGYVRFTLHSANAAGTDAGIVEALVLEGAAVEGAHFNLKERRNAASVHLAYPLPAGVTNVEAFYCEVTAVDDPVWTFYMACGWHRGYFGMQVISPKERRIIFSVWDSGGEPDDRNKVAAENRVRLLGKGEGVYSGDFGNEGTGGHSHLKYLWKTGETQRFLMTAKPTTPTNTVFSGYYFHPDQKRWFLISSWVAPKEGGYPRGLHSFSENFVGDNGQVRRKALFGNQWVRTVDGRWFELTTASFSHDPTGKADRLDRFMGVEAGQFFLSHGGFTDGFTRYGEKFTRPATGRQPQDLELPQ